ncbi:hypothetical protein ZIOFF_037565 [Zingiber officinale]|uniref:Uncharacterized protein n=1 Tax=Zingiber officinale TaxID=94328 RepID=A0A8J5L9B6_ZINOF|nr:hypothetical protein ZIOFF_037565 [Zingiber officinale]
MWMWANVGAIVRDWHGQVLVAKGSDLCPGVVGEEAEAMNAVKAAVGDALITFVWMFCISALGVATFVIKAAFQIHGEAFSLLVTSSLVFVIVFVFNAIADALGGASFNPTGNAAFYAAGFGDDSLISMAIRFPAQAAGAIGGLLALYEVMPPEYKNMLVGPYLKVDLHTGAIAEGVLTFVISVAVLCIVFKGPRSALVKTLMITICTLGVIIAGNGYTGPSMNPANVSAPDFSVTSLLLPLSECTAIPRHLAGLMSTIAIIRGNNSMSTGSSLSLVLLLQVGYSESSSPLAHQ